MPEGARVVLWGVGIAFAICLVLGLAGYLNTGKYETGDEVTVYREWKQKLNPPAGFLAGSAVVPKATPKTPE